MLDGGTPCSAVRRARLTARRRWISAILMSAAGWPRQSDHGSACSFCSLGDGFWRVWHQGSGRLVLTHGRRAFPRSVEDAERRTDRSVLRPAQVDHVEQTAIEMPDAPHLRVCLIPHDMQDGTAAALNVKGPCAILMPAPCE